MKDKIAFLRKTKIFGALDDTALSRIAALLKQRDFENDQTIIERYDTGTSMFLIVSGGANVYYVKGDDEDTLLGNLLPGQHFGEMSLFDNKPRSAMVRSSGGTSTFVIEKDDLFTLINEDPATGVKILLAIIHELSIRLRDTSAALFMSLNFGDTLMNQNDIDRFGEFYSDVLRSERSASKH